MNDGLIFNIFDERDSVPPGLAVALDELDDILAGYQRGTFTFELVVSQAREVAKWSESYASAEAGRLDEEDWTT